MLAKNAYPKKDSHEAQKKLADDGLDFYFVASSLLVNVEGIARFGAMLANGGINPSTGEKCIGPETVKATVTIMQTCGMHDSAGKFTKQHGVPAKSSQSGAFMTVIPGTCAISSFSPPLNADSNPIRGIALLQRLSKVYSNFNLFHKDSQMLDLTKKHYQTILSTVNQLNTAASSGDVETVHRLHVQGLDLNKTDYDGRTALHLSAAGGHFFVVTYLVSNGANVNPLDRWKATPLDDASDPKIVEYLTKHGGIKGAGGQVNHKNSQKSIVNDNQVRLLYAAYFNHFQNVQSLNVLGWKVNATDYDGRTALSIAASEGHLECVKYLVLHGAKLDHKDYRNNTALDDARREGRKDVVAWLEDYIQKQNTSDTHH